MYDKTTKKNCNIYRWITIKNEKLDQSEGQRKVNNGEQKKADC